MFSRFGFQNKFPDVDQKNLQWETYSSHLNYSKYEENNTFEPIVNLL